MSNKGEFLVIPGKWEIPYEYSAGETFSKFFIELRDNARIMATRCFQCERILLPPRSFCERCFIPVKDNWVKLDPIGELRAFTIVTSKFSGQPDPPYVVCYVTLGGSTTAIPHFLNGVDLSDIDKAKNDIKIGMAVRAVFKERAKREGRMTDFSIEVMK